LYPQLDNCGHYWLDALSSNYAEGHQDLVDARVSAIQQRHAQRLVAILQMELGSATSKPDFVPARQAPTETAFLIVLACSEIIPQANDRGR
jgi:hypothetical protein